MSKTWSTWPAAVAAVCLASLAACGGGGGGDGAPATAPSPAASAASAPIGQAGGIVSEPGGAKVSIPAGALAATVTIGVEESTAGAPPLPSGVSAAGPTVAFTPHGTSFAVPVSVTVPFDPATLAAGSTPVLYKTNPAGAWEVVAGATVVGNTMVGNIRGFSWAVAGSALPGVGLAREDWLFKYALTAADPQKDTFEIASPGSSESRPLALEYAPFKGSVEGAVAVQPFAWPNYWYGEVNATTDGGTFWAGAVAPIGDNTKPGQRVGLLTQLLVTRVLRKKADTASQKVVFSQANMALIDGNPHEPFGNECPWFSSLQSTDCLQTLNGWIQITIDAWAVLPNGGVLQLRHAKADALFRGYRSVAKKLSATTAADSEVFVWDTDNFDFVHDPQAQTSGQEARVELRAPVSITIPLDTVTTGAEFTVQVKIIAAAYNRRQGESFIGVLARDPAASVPGVQFEESGVELVREPLPRPLPVPPAPPVPIAVPACSGAPDPAAGTLEFEAATLHGYEGGFADTLVAVRRSGGAKGAASVMLNSADGSARAGMDYTPVSTIVRFEDGEQGTRTVALPIVDNDRVDGDRTVLLNLGSTGGCAALGAQASATLVIHDNDKPLAAPTYKVSGTVGGLAGTDLVLVDRLGSSGPVTPTANGPIVLSTGVLDRTGYDIVVQTQPTNPAQSCVVTNGAGTINGADVSNVAITCTTVAASGALDTSFGAGSGKVSNAFSAAKAIALQGDGKLLAVGGMTLSRYLVDGTLDTSFGSAGKVTIVANGGGADAMQAVAVQGDGRIVVAGFTSKPTPFNDDFVILRFNADGSPDTGFGTGGKTIVDFAGLTDRVHALVLQGDGKIVAAGFATLGTLATADQDVALVRLTSAGALDAAFGSGGKATLNVAGKADFGYAAALQADGKIVVAGRVANDGGANPDFGVVRFLATGLVDTGFGTNGITRVDFGSAVWDEAGDVLVQGDGAIVVGGFTQTAGVYRYALARLTSGGTLDASFGTAGKASTPFTGSGDFARALALQADGRIIVAGQLAATSGNPDMGIARYDASGVLDPTFGAAGLVRVDFFGAIDNANDVLVQPDGRIVAAGSARNGSTTGLGVVRVVP